MSRGYRLDYMEVFNWGTFDGQVFRLIPGQRTSLLTGANGSGKTTLVDALLTLLVPSGKRFYNQSSGADSKKERGELSYFWGYYGKSMGEDDEKPQTEQLRRRDSNPYSVLLACFKDAEVNQEVTLVQLRWFANGELKRAFVVSQHPLQVAEHFGEGSFDTKGDWKKKLVKAFSKTEVFESFKDYSVKFSELFGIRDKALSLFNQTVGIKVLGDLTQFIRGHMLEEPDAQTQFDKLHEHYMNLMLSHQAIRKDEKQLSLLEPVMELKTELEQVKTEIEQYKLTKVQVPLFLNELEINLLEMANRELEAENELQEAEIKQVKQFIVSKQKGRDELIEQRAKLNLDARIQSLKTQIETEGEKRDAKRYAAERYAVHIAALKLNPATDNASFLENRKFTELLEAEWKQKSDKLGMEKFELGMDRKNLQRDINAWQAEIDSLLNRRNRMPVDLIRVRSELAQLLDTSEDTLPFVGELIQVLPEEKHWEDSIERVLHGFAMQLLVPQRFHKQVNAYVNGNNLRTRLVYQRIEDRIQASRSWTNNSDSLLNKLDFKKGSPMIQWLEQEMIYRYDYHCTDDLDDFFGSKMAITSKGLIRNLARHEKDDRQGQAGWNPLKYRLGWENQSTVRLLMNDKRAAENRITEIAQELTRIEPMLASLEKLKENGTLLKSTASFQDIDPSPHLLAVHEFEQQLAELMESSDGYLAIVKRLNEADSALQELEEQRKKLQKRIDKIEDQLLQQNGRLLELDCEELTEEGKLIAAEFIFSSLQTQILPRSVKELNQVNGKIHEAIYYHELQLNRREKKSSEVMLQRIGEFCRPTPAILQEFPAWGGDVQNIAVAIESLPEIEDIYKEIKHHRLVENKKRFRDYMDNSMVDALTDFRTWLDHEEEKIREVIDDLNEPLKRITFNRNPDTYLQLECRATPDQQMRAFRDLLKDAIPDYVTFASQKEEAYRDSVFVRIRDLINELKKEEAWRRKVTDVRNRLVFNAREFSFMDNKKGAYHDDTASYSGGQKAQFTYAILGAAIAHQFGIFHYERAHRCLRFITVDEAFSKLDPQKSRFLMEYCEQLDLQLLVVTPLDKINIAEEYISAVHFVDIQNKQYSRLFNLTIEEYLERKDEFKKSAALESRNA